MSVLGAPTRDSLSRVLVDTPKHLFLYGGFYYLAGWVADKIWWAGVVVFAGVSIVIALDAIQHLALLLTLPAEWSKPKKPKSDAAADTVATAIRIAESVFLIVFGYVTYLKLAGAA
ncbi:MAG: hypothetical protein H6509_01815 [Bryobacterales bacterium]|nr:hypothetical protein [Acidobacteriota bacterium]MCB9383324.1 hypothetical protein [Bryobacterales bacterium]